MAGLGSKLSSSFLGVLRSVLRSAKILVLQNAGRRTPNSGIIDCVLYFCSAFWDLKNELPGHRMRTGEFPGLSIVFFVFVTSSRIADDDVGRHHWRPR